MARQKIRIQPKFDFILIGIVTPLQDYRLAWYLNQVLYKSLARSGELVITDPENHIQMGFARFDYYEELTKSMFHFLQNKHASQCLLPEMRDLDFLLLIKGDYYKSRKAGMLKKIRSIEHIQAAVIIEVEGVKSRNNLLVEGNE